jgi:ferrochelatase
MADFVYNDINDIKKLCEFRYALVFEHYEDIEAVLAQSIDEPTLF